MKKKYNHHLIGLLLLTLFVACNEEEVQSFSDKPGVNFMEYVGTTTGGEEIWSDGYLNLFKYANSFADYPDDDFGSVKDIKIRLGIKLEGLISETPLKVKFKVLPVEDYDLPDIILPEEDVEIKAGEYTTYVTLPCKAPTVLDKQFKAQLTFDYENSDVVPGTYERQKYEITVEDSFRWDLMSVESKEEWEQYFKPVLGDFGQQKVRFFAYAFKQLGLDLEMYSMYFVLYSYDLISDEMPSVKNILDNYNAEHPDEQVKESDGTPVTFP